MGDHDRLESSYQAVFHALTIPAAVPDYSGALSGELSAGILSGRMKNGWIYALACVVLPVAWGLLMYRASALLERFFGSREGSRSSDSKDSGISLEYHI